MNIGKVVRIIRKIEAPQPIAIPVKDWPKHGGEAVPIVVPNWPVKVPEKIEVR